MYFCKNCGRMAQPGEHSCPRCGAPHTAEPPRTQAAPAEPAAPQYQPAAEAPDVPAMSFGGTLGMLIVFAIPVVGFIMMLVWSFADTPDTARQRLARAYLVRTLILATVLALLFLLGALGIATLSHRMYYYWG